MRSFVDLLGAKEHEREERETIREKAHSAEVGGLRSTIDGLKTKLDKKDEELEWFREKYEREDEDRDARLERLEDWKKKEADPWISRVAKAAAPEVAEINKPQTEADGATAAATMINKVRKTESLKQVAYFVGLVLLALAQLLGWRIPDTKPNVEIPDIHPPPAGTGFAGRP